MYTLHFQFFKNLQKFFLKLTALYRAMSLKIPNKIMAFKPTKFFKNKCNEKFALKNKRNIY